VIVERQKEGDSSLRGVIPSEVASPGKKKMGLTRTFMD